MPAGVVQFTRDCAPFKTGDIVGFSNENAWGYVQDGNAQWVLAPGEKPPTASPAQNT